MEWPAITIPSDFDAVAELQIQLVNSQSLATATEIRSQLITRMGGLLTAFQRQEVDEWEGMSHAQMLDQIIERRWYLVQNFGFGNEVRAYMGEAEHQDGFTYWLQFPDNADVLYDFNLYMEAMEE